MYTPRNQDEVRKLFKDIECLWKERGLAEGQKETDSMHVHVSLYDSNGKEITTTTHPFLEFFMQTIYVRDKVAEQWKEEIHALRIPQFLYQNVFHRMTKVCDTISTSIRLLNHVIPT